MELILQELLRDEGFRSKPYKDTKGKTTIGIGRNLDDVGITKEEADYLCINDVSKAMTALDIHLPWWSTLGEVRQRVLVNMVFNMGIATVLTFRRTLSLIESGKYSEASAAMLGTLWAQQVGPRAIRLADMMEKGENYGG
jgi:lysozyme